MVVSANETSAIATAPPARLAKARGDSAGKLGEIQPGVIDAIAGPSATWCLCSHQPAAPAAITAINTPGNRGASRRGNSTSAMQARPMTAEITFVLPLSTLRAVWVRLCITAPFEVSIPSKRGISLAMSVTAMPLR